MAYHRALRPYLSNLPDKTTALEIGAGTGGFLELLKNDGFEIVIGVEPSTSAIAAAPPHRQPWLREAMFDVADFAPESIDLICCFMTLEHVRDPLATVAGAASLLRPNGTIALVTHDYRSVINRLLGRRSPIIDIEHMQLFSPKSLKALLDRAGFETLSITSYSNRYALRYWLRLFPLSDSLKRSLLAGLILAGVQDVKFSANVGNMLAVARRRA